MKYISIARYKYITIQNNMNEFYVVTNIESEKINLSETEKEIYNWKLNKIQTYISNVKYINKMHIIISITIYNYIYNFNVIHVDNLWEININSSNDEMNNIIEHINKIVDNINKNKNADLILFLNNIEQVIDDY